MCPWQSAALECIQHTHQQVHSKLCRCMFATDGGLLLSVLTASMRTAVKSLPSLASVTASCPSPVQLQVARWHSTLPALCRCMSVPALAVMEQPLAAAMGPSSTILTSLP